MKDRDIEFHKRWLGLAQLLSRRCCWRAVKRPRARQWTSNFRARADNGRRCMPHTAFKGRCSADTWASPLINVLVNILNSDGNIESKPGTLLNLSGPVSIETHRVQLLELRDATFSKVIQLWDERDQLFPNINFCASVQQDLRRWSYGSSILERVRFVMTER